MYKRIDARGMQCPIPVIETKKVLQSMREGTVEILVDNSIAVQNLVKMANQKNFECSTEKIDDDNYVVRIITVPELSGVDSMNEVVNVFPSDENVDNDTNHETKTGAKLGSSLEEHPFLELREDDTVVVLSTDCMGSGDDKLGKTLMKGFIYALTEVKQLPKKIILYNGGAKLSVEGSDSLDDLKLLESQGVEILTCGACLNYYEINTKLAVGSVTNMYAIAEIMMAATKIIKP